MIDYDAHSWTQHFFDVRGSMVRQIAHRVLACTLLSIAVVVAHEAGFHASFAPQGHLMIGVALGLLLVFRTNASYDRFWEGRRLWGSIVNDARNLSRSASVWLATDATLVRDIVHSTIALAYASMHHLRGEHSLGAAGRLFDPEVKEPLVRTQHVPLAVACRLSALIDSARERQLVSEYRQVALDQHVQRLIDSIGGCERIHKTPLPFAYVVHLRRALMAYCFTLPFALLDTFGDGIIVATLLISYTLYGIEEIGVQIEDPFGIDDNDLPLERICATIDANLCELLRYPVMPPAAPALQAVHQETTPPDATAQEEPAELAVPWENPDAFPGSLRVTS